MWKRLTPVLIAMLGWASVGTAGPIYGTEADYSGSRTEGQFVTGGNWAGDSLTQSLSWTVVDHFDGTLTYSYSFINFARPSIDHFILDLTDDAVSPGDPRAVVGPTLNGSAIASDKLEFGAFGSSPSAPEFPSGSGITGVKFDVGVEGTNVFQFVSNRLPVWGDFYLKGGGGSYAYNAGLLKANRASSNAYDFIARPNGAPLTLVPEPGSIALFAIGLGTLGLVGLRRKSRTRGHA